MLVDDPAEVLGLLSAAGVSVERREVDLGYRTGETGTRRHRQAISEARDRESCQKPWDAVICRLEELEGTGGILGNKQCYLIRKDDAVVLAIELRDFVLKVTTDVSIQ